MPLSLQHRRYMMGVVMLLMFMPPGMWVSSLPNILETYEAVWVLPYATALPAAGAIYTFSMVAGRIFLDKRVPDTMRGQAQALFQFLAGSVAGITGAFFCGWLYRVQVTEALDSWVDYWLGLAFVALVPLLYFIAGVVRKDAR